MSSSPQARSARVTPVQLGVAAGVLLVLLAVVLVARTTSSGTVATSTAPTTTSPTTVGPAGSGAVEGAAAPVGAAAAPTSTAVEGSAPGAPSTPGPAVGSAAPSAPATTPAPVVLSDPDGIIGLDGGPGSPRPPMTSLPVTVAVTPSGASGAQTLDIHVAAAAGSQVFGFEARLCAADVKIEWDADFNPTQGGKCIAHELTPTADAKLEAIAAPPFQSVDATFHVGAGRDTYEVQGVGPTTIDCSPGRTCQLVLKIQVPNGFGFRSQPVTVA